MGKSLQLPDVPVPICICIYNVVQVHMFVIGFKVFSGLLCLRQEEEEEESFYIHVPSPIGLIGWNIQHMPEVFNGVTCPSSLHPEGIATQCKDN